MDNQRRSHSSIRQSRFEVIEDGNIRYDYYTAHNGVGDPDYTLPLPKTCKTCYHQAQAAIELGLEPPTRPDEEITDDPGA